MLRGIVTDELIDRRKEIEHPLVRQQPLLVERRDVLAIDLTDESEGIFSLRSILFRDLHHRVLRLRWQIRVAPPFAAAEKVGLRLSGFQTYCHILQLSKIIVLFWHSNIRWLLLIGEDIVFPIGVCACL